MLRDIVKYNDTYYEINNDYEYEDQDITAILNAMTRRCNVDMDILVCAMASIDTITPRQLEIRLEQDRRKNPPGKRVILIPCNIGNTHWTGLLLEFDESDDCIRAEFMNSTSSSIPSGLQKQLQLVYHIDFTLCHNVIKQNDGKSCGTCTIENLIMRVSRGSPSERISMAQLRAKQLDILRTDSEEINISEQN